MRLFVALLLAAAFASPAAARTAADAAPPAAIQQMLSCRQVTDSVARLACFDRAAGDVATGITSKDLVVVDRERARSASRSVFGFSVANFGNLFGSGSDVNAIDGTIKSVSSQAYGGYNMRLADGSAWVQTDDTTLGLPPRAGDPVIIKRGALGSFVMSVRKQPGMKVKRVE